MLCASPTRSNIRKRSRHLQPTRLSQPSNLAIQAMTRQPFETALLVTGASGLLGGEVLAQATRQPHPGFLAVWGTWHSQPWALPGSKGYALDVTDRSAVLRLVEQLQPDAIVHTAYLKDGPQAHAVTARGTSHIAEAAAAVGARLVHVSSDVIFDGEHAPYDETAAPAPVHPYGEAKAEAEAEVQRLAPSAAIVRTSLINRLDPPDRITAWIVDCLRPTPHPTHAHFDRVLEWVAAVKPRRAVLTHMGHLMDYRRTAERCPPGMEPAHDGMVIAV